MKYRYLLHALLFWSAVAHAGADEVMAVTRNNATNFKDRALAYCVAQAYPGSPAGQDATRTGGAFLDWTYYDPSANSAIDELIARYLRRDYSTPVEGYAGARFALLKCIDMYHSLDLDELVRQYVPHPEWIGDAPSRTRPK